MASTPWKCTVCKARFATSEEMEAHEKTHEPPLPIVEEPAAEEHKCHLCPRVFESADRLARHIEVYEDLKIPHPQEPVDVREELGLSAAEEQQQISTGEERVDPPAPARRRRKKTDAEIAAEGLAEQDRAAAQAIARLDVEIAPESPGIYEIAEETYHAGPGVSRSKLWTLFSKTPFHARYEDKATTKPQRFGKASHTAVLEPTHFEARFERGPDARGNSNIWKDAEAAAIAAGRTLLKPAEFDDVLRLRDAAHRDRTVQMLTRGRTAIEHSAYYIDEVTGELCRVRPDIFNYDFGIMADLKSTASAAPREFQSSIAEYGYHVQDHMYPLGWTEAGGPTVNGFVFIAIESKAPFAMKVYEIEQFAQEEAAVTYRTALDNYHQCATWERNARRENEARAAAGKTPWPADKLEAHIAETCWPSYGRDVAPISLPAWGFKLRPTS